MAKSCLKKFYLKVPLGSQVWWHTQLILTLERLRQEYICEFKTILVYKVSFKPVTLRSLSPKIYQLINYSLLNEAKSVYF